MTTSIKKYRFAATFKSVNKVHGTGETISATFSVLSKDKAKYDRVLADLGELLDDGGRVTITTVLSSRDYTVENLQPLSAEIIPADLVDGTSTDIWYFTGFPSYAEKYNVLLDVEYYTSEPSGVAVQHDTATNEGDELVWPDGSPMSWEEVQELRNTVAAYEVYDAAKESAPEADHALTQAGDGGVERIWLLKALHKSARIMIVGNLATLAILAWFLFHR